LRHAAYKILVDSSEHILGAHFLSDNTTGLVNTFAQAMRGGVTVSELHENSILSPYPSRESDILYMLSPLVE
jgi:glutathione reductase (NADPH)